MQNHLHTNKPNEEIPFAGEVLILYYLKPCTLTQKNGLRASATNVLKLMSNLTRKPQQR
jgi:hypothetical protein